MPHSPADFMWQGPFVMGEFSYDGGAVSQRSDRVFLLLF